MLDFLKVDELKEILRENGLSISGNKHDLIRRLKKDNRGGNMVFKWIGRKYTEEYRELNKKLQRKNEELREEILELNRERGRLQQSNNKLQREMSQLKLERQKRNRSVANYERMSIGMTIEQGSKNSSFAGGISIAGPSAGSSSSLFSSGQPAKKRMKRSSELQLYDLETELDRERPITKDLFLALISGKTKLDAEQIHGWLELQKNETARYFGCTS